MQAITTCIGYTADSLNEIDSKFQMSTSIVVKLPLRPNQAPESYSLENFLLS